MQKQLNVRVSPIALHTPYYHVSGFSFPGLSVLTTEAPDIIQTCAWGLIPFWCKDQTQAMEVRNVTLNAKAETIFEKASFKASIKYKRCIIPIDGFFEWRTYQSKKYPYYIRSQSGELMLLAGVYDYWTHAFTGDIHFTFSIVTTAANKMMQAIHNTKERMPLILSHQQAQAWLDKRSSQSTLQLMMKPQTDGRLKAHTVSRLVTSRTENTNVERVMQLHPYPELPPLFDNRQLLF